MPLPLPVRRARRARRMRENGAATGAKLPSLRGTSHNLGAVAPNICYRCHCDKQEMQQIAGPHQICGPNGFNCTTCHDPHGKLKEETRKDLCLTCHQGSPWRGTPRRTTTFEEALAQLRGLQLEPEWIHVSNSAALLTGRRFPENLVRIGALLYGYCVPLIVPPGQELPKVPDFEPVLSFKSRIVYMKDVPSGTPLGYSAAFFTRRPSRIATVPVGYADGLSHALSNRGFAIVRGRRARIVGSISMDLSLLDVTDVAGTNIGDEVILIGQADHSSITAVEIAQMLDTVPYEVLCSIGKRVPRIYVD